MLWKSFFLAGNPEEEAALQRVAEELREIAAQLEENVVAQATQNLRRNILITPCNVSVQHIYFFTCHILLVMDYIMVKLYKHSWWSVLSCIKLSDSFYVICIICISGRYLYLHMDKICKYAQYKIKYFS